MPESVSVTLELNPAARRHTADTMDLVQDKNKAAFAHEHIFGSDFSLIIGKNIPSADKHLETTDRVDSSCLGDPRRSESIGEIKEVFFWSIVA